ncbi:MAG: ATP-binding protein [Planctomycetota bacterium]
MRWLDACALGSWQFEVEWLSTADTLLLLALGLVVLVSWIARIQDRGSLARLLHDPVLEEELDAVEAPASLFGSVLSSLTEGVAVFGEERRLLMANSSFRELFDCPPAQHLPETARNVELRALVDEAFAKRTRIESHIERSEKDGEQRIEVTVSPIRDESDRFLMILLVRDVTERHRLEEGLRHAQRMESVGSLAGGIAHDFNNLLGGILGYASFVRHELPKESSLVEAALKIEAAASRAAELSGQLLTLARQEPARREPVDVSLLLGDAASVLERTLAHEVSIELECTKDLPAVEADQPQLFQVFLNLAVNARDAMPRGGTLSLTAHALHLNERDCRSRPGLQPGEYILIRVSDTGVGMSPETLAHLFDPFFTTKERGQGTGLGCTIAYQIVRAHGGALEVRSAPQRGTTFDIYLPASRRRVRPTPHETTELARGQETILVVDDEEIIRQLAQEILQKIGYRTLAAKDGLEAITLFHQHRDDIDLVLLDLAMPRIGGLEAARRIRSQRSDVRILLSTGFGDTGHPEFACVQKPYKMEDLASAVRKCLDTAVR